MKEKMSPQEKMDELQGYLKELGRVLLAFSGGVDSSFLLTVLHQSQVETLAVTGRSATMPEWDRQSVEEVVKLFDLPHRYIDSGEMADADFVKNPVNRCFYCKNNLFGRLQELAQKEGYDVVVDGSTADDLNDYRPGLLARNQHQVFSPLMAVGLTKDEVRSLSRAAGLPTWNRAASPCLSSRVTYGDPIEERSLRMIEAAEHWLHGLGFSEVRVRKQGETARVELPVSDFPQFLTGELRQKTVTFFLELGFRFVSLDLEGFQSGRLNRLVL
ncbi:MAG: ATP-dependent sacrificial sulfur transferase LarE [Magnetococcales bacterium]|nr:ATP-dependent sacrificial sulfur transferase LarE [Magnetococcales bacterium]